MGVKLIFLESLGGDGTLMSKFEGHFEFFPLFFDQLQFFMVGSLIAWRQEMVAGNGGSEKSLGPHRFQNINNATCIQLHETTMYRRVTWTVIALYGGKKKNSNAHS